MKTIAAVEPPFEPPGTRGFRSRIVPSYVGLIESHHQ
jgi:hypothetical protein